MLYVTYLCHPIHIQEYHAYYWRTYNLGYSNISVYSIRAKQCLFLLLYSFQGWKYYELLICKNFFFYNEGKWYLLAFKILTYIHRFKASIWITWIGVWENSKLKFCLLLVMTMCPKENIVQKAARLRWVFW